MSLSDHVRTLGRGPSRARSLTLEEARNAMTKMMSNDASPEAIGALLMLLRMKGETADEIAGFTQGARVSLPQIPTPDLDWPSYAAGRTRGLPWFLCASRLVAEAGYRVLIHGSNAGDTTVLQGARDLSIPIAETPSALNEAFSKEGLAYLPLETLSPRLQDLLDLRNVLGLRSCMNTVCRMLDPGGAGRIVQGVFHPSYRVLQAKAAERLELTDLTVIKGGGGEFECAPGKEISAFGLRDGNRWSSTYPAIGESAIRLADLGSPMTSISPLWNGQISDRTVEEVVVGTAALALETLGETDPLDLAQELWGKRHRRLAA